jgi:hypothetical protein
MDGKPEYALLDPFNERQLGFAIAVVKSGE